jgi:energy-converting hydrogenase Eha subunit A
MAQNNNHPLEDAIIRFFRVYALNVFLALLMVGIGAWMAFLIATSDGKSPKEAAYQALILTIASVIASLIITRIYAEQGHGQSLRDHGVQIAGGIIVLKRQLEALSDWIASKRLSMRSSAHTPEVTDAVLEHIEQTLFGFQGMTDAALGGIAGVIGDALAQYESVMEQISRIRLDALHRTREIQQQIETAESSAEIAALQSQIQEIALKTDRDIAQLARRSAIPISEPPKRISDDPPTIRAFSSSCPLCSKENSFQMRDRVGETKQLWCEHCQSGFNAHLGFGGQVIVRSVPGRTSDASISVCQAEVLRHLRRTQTYVEPRQLLAVLKAIAQADSSIAGDKSAERTVYKLTGIVLGYTNSGELIGVSRGAVRIVFKILFEAHAFQFSSGLPSASPLRTLLTSGRCLRLMFADASLDLEG